MHTGILQTNCKAQCYQKKKNYEFNILLLFFPLHLQAHLRPWSPPNLTSDR